MNKLLFTLLILGIGSLVTSQSLSDALRYSTTYAGGTARTVGAGGAFGALGGDFGALSINPAGLATYRSSEITFSAAVIAFDPL